MKVIMLEKIRNLGNLGETVTVRAGYARNYLIPYNKAVMATAANTEKFAKMRAELEQQALEGLQAAQARAESLADYVVTIASKATEEGKLFGSIAAGNIATALASNGVNIKKSEISLPQGPIRTVGEFEVTLLLHTDVATKIKVRVVADKE